MVNEGESTPATDAGFIQARLASHPKDEAAPLKAPERGESTMLAMLM